MITNVCFQDAIKTVSILLGPRKKMLPNSKSAVTPSMSGQSMMPASHTLSPRYHYVYLHSLASCRPSRCVRFVQTVHHPRVSIRRMQETPRWKYPLFRKQQMCFVRKTCAGKHNIGLLSMSYSKVVQLPFEDCRHERSERGLSRTI